LGAARRERQIAEYHSKELGRRLDPVPKPEPDDSCPIPVQAHFEGVVTSVIEAVDKVAQAINAKLRLGAGPGQLFDKSYGELAPDIQNLESWREKPIGKDLRLIRVRIAHYSYGKVPFSEGSGGPEGWKVEDPRVGYKGSRELKAYAQAAVDHAGELIGLIPAIESVLRARAPRGKQDPEC